MTRVSTVGRRAALLSGLLAENTNAENYVRTHLLHGCSRASGPWEWDRVTHPTLLNTGVWMFDGCGTDDLKSEYEVAWPYGGSGEGTGSGQTGWGGTERVYGTFALSWLVC